MWDLNDLHNPEKGIKVFFFALQYTIAGLGYLCAKLFTFKLGDKGNHCA